jgi:hypothetical protein
MAANFAFAPIADEGFDALLPAVAVLAEGVIPGEILQSAFKRARMVISSVGVRTTVEEACTADLAKHAIYNEHFLRHGASHE